MSDIDEEVTIYKLNIDPTFRLIQWKSRRFSEDKEWGMKAEVAKLLQAGFIREVKYHTWLANVVMVKKSMANGEYVLTS